MKTQLVAEFTDIAFPVKAEQTGIDSFTVTYGFQVTKGLSYDDAAKELGYCMFHAFACDGKISNGS